MESPVVIAIGLFFIFTKHIYMKIFFHTLLLSSVLLVTGCHEKSVMSVSAPQLTASIATDSVTDTSHYKGIYFVRQGGGNIEFEMTHQKDSIQIQLHKLQFKDSSLTLNCSAQAFDSASIALVDSLVQGSLPIKEEEEESKRILMTGTWVYTYAIKHDGGWDTITLKRAKDAMRIIEDSVRIQLEKSDTNSQETNE